jgi:esterase
MQLSCRTYGDPGRPTLVLLHGLFGSSGNWGSVARHLASHYRLLVPDLRNHGRSPHAPLHDYPSMAGDLLELLDHHGVRAPIVVGHSMGGKVAMHLALTTPARVAGLVVVDMAPVRYSHGFDAVLRAFAAVDLTAIASRADANAQMRSAVPVSAVRAFLLQNLERHDGRWCWRLNLEALAAAQATITGFPDYPGPAVYEGRTLFVHGELSDYVRPSHHPVIQRCFPGAGLQVIEGAGHWVYADQPTAFLEVLDRFLDAVA